VIIPINYKLRVLSFAILIYNSYYSLKISMNILIILYIWILKHTNKAWSLECGWENHEVSGLTCAFLQGELTDVKTAAAFTKVTITHV
jgi:hypothetical protein